MSAVVHPTTIYLTNPNSDSVGIQKKTYAYINQKSIQLLVLHGEKLTTSNQ